MLKKCLGRSEHRPTAETEKFLWFNLKCIFWERKDTNEKKQQPLAIGERKRGEEGATELRVLHNSQLWVNYGNESQCSINYYEALKRNNHFLIPFVKQV